MTMPSVDTIMSGSAVLIVAGFGIYNTWFNKKKEVEKEADDMESKVITLLKDTVSALEKRVAELEKRLTDSLVNLTRLQAEKDSLQADKNALAAVLSGRDAQGMEMMKQSTIAMQNIAEMAPLVKEMHTILKQR